MQINIEKRHLFLIFSIITFLAGIILVYAGNPAVAGHSSDELAPPTPCSASQFLQWTGTAWVCAAGGSGSGDITDVIAGTGLSGGATSGSATLSVNAPSCSASTQKLLWTTGSGFSCGTDQSSGGSGTVTSITAGTGLSGGTITTAGTISADTNYLQRIIADFTCPSQQAVTSFVNHMPVCGAVYQPLQSRWAFLSNMGSQDCITTCSQYSMTDSPDANNRYCESSGSYGDRVRFVLGEFHCMSGASNDRGVLGGCYCIA